MAFSLLLSLDNSFEHIADTDKESTCGRTSSQQQQLVSTKHHTSSLELWGSSAVKVSFSFIISPGLAPSLGTLGYEEVHIGFYVVVAVQSNTAAMLQDWLQSCWTLHTNIGGTQGMAAGRETFSTLWEEKS